MRLVVSVAHGNNAVKKCGGSRGRKATMGSVVPVPQDVSHVLTGSSIARLWVSEIRRGCQQLSPAFILNFQLNIFCLPTCLQYSLCIYLGTVQETCFSTKLSE